jgi:flagellar basal-body rod protein FlgG
MLASMRRMELVTNNLANAQTIGFKQDRSALSTFDEVMLQQDGATSTKGAKLGELGMASVAEEPMIDFTQGALEDTGRSLDMALEGPGFFTVQTPDGTRYTRDGGFTRDALGRMTTTDGHLVLDTANNPITIPGGKMTVDQDGTVRMDNQPMAKLQIVEFTLDQPIRKVGANEFVARNDGDQPTPSGGTAVHQGFIEGSNLDMAGAQTQMMELQRAYQASQRLVQYQDEMVGRAVNDIARPVN